MKRKNNLGNDLGVIITSIFVALMLVHTGTIDELINQTYWLGPLQIFIAGLFFTSIFTAAPAIVALSELAITYNSVYIIALFGALGAMCGDLLIYYFSRDSLARDVSNLMSMESRRKWRHIIHFKLFRWFLSLIGGIVIASPLPDELGLMLMGLSKPKLKTLVPVSLVCNFVGIAIIATLAQKLI